MEGNPQHHDPASYGLMSPSCLTGEPSRLMREMQDEGDIMEESNAFLEASHGDGVGDAALELVELRQGVRELLQFAKVFETQGCVNEAAEIYQSAEERLQQLVRLPSSTPGTADTQDKDMLNFVQERLLELNTRRIQEHSAEAEALIDHAEALAAEGLVDEAKDAFIEASDVYMELEAYAETREERTQLSMRVMQILARVEELKGQRPSDTHQGSSNHVGDGDGARKGMLASLSALTEPSPTLARRKTSSAPTSPLWTQPGSSLASLDHNETNEVALKRGSTDSRSTQSTFRGRASTDGKPFSRPPRDPRHDSREHLTAIEPLEEDLERFENISKLSDAPFQYDKTPCLTISDNDEFQRFPYAVQSGIFSNFADSLLTLHAATALTTIIVKDIATFSLNDNMRIFGNALGWLPRLQEVEISNMNLNDEGAKLLAQGLQRSQTIIKLNLGDNAIGDKGFEAICKFLLSPSQKSLRHLCMIKNELSETSAVALAQILPQSTTLYVVELQQNMIGCSGVDALIEARKQHQLTIFVSDKHDSKRGCKKDHKKNQQVVMQRRDPKAEFTKAKKKMSMQLLSPYQPDRPRSAMSRRRPSSDFATRVNSKGSELRDLMDGGLTMKDMCETYQKLFDPLKDHVKMPTILLVGQKHVGKSSLIDAAFGVKVATQDFKHGDASKPVEYRDSSHRFCLWDTVSLSPMGNVEQDCEPIYTLLVQQSVQKDLSKHVHAMWYVIASPVLQAIDTKFIEYLGRKAKTYSIPVFVIINKADTMTEEQLQTIQEALDKASFSSLIHAVYPTIADRSAAYRHISRSLVDAGAPTDHASMRTQVASIFDHLEKTRHKFINALETTRDILPRVARLGIKATETISLKRREANAADIIRSHYVKFVTTMHQSMFRHVRRGGKKRFYTHLGKLVGRLCSLWGFIGNGDTHQQYDHQFGQTIIDAVTNDEGSSKLVASSQGSGPDPAYLVSIGMFWSLVLRHQRDQCLACAASNDACMHTGDSAILVAIATLKSKCSFLSSIHDAVLETLSQQAQQQGSSSSTSPTPTGPSAKTTGPSSVSASTLSSTMNGSPSPTQQLLDVGTGKRASNSDAANLQRPMTAGPTSAKGGRRGSIMKRRASFGIHSISSSTVAGTNSNPSGNANNAPQSTVFYHLMRHAEKIIVDKPKRRSRSDSMTASISGSVCENLVKLLLQPSITQDVRDAFISSYVVSLKVPPADVLDAFALAFFSHAYSHNSHSEHICSVVVATLASWIKVLFEQDFISAKATKAFKKHRKALEMRQYQQQVLDAPDDTLEGDASQPFEDDHLVTLERSVFPFLSQLQEKGVRFSSVVRQLITFMNEIGQTPLANLSEKLHKALEGSAATYIAAMHQPEEVVLVDNNFDFALLFDECCIATHICYANASFMKRFHARDLFDAKSTSRQGMIKFANQVTYWTVANIVTRHNLGQRVHILAKFIHIAEHLHRKPLFDFQGFMAVMAALQLSYVRRLKKTWTKLKKDRPETFRIFEEELTPLTNPGNGMYSAILDHFTELQQTHKGMIPFLGSFLTGIERARSSSKGKGANNVEKALEMLSVTENIAKTLSSFIVPDQVRDWEDFFLVPQFVLFVRERLVCMYAIESSKERNALEDDLNSESLACEPRTPEGAKEKDENAASGKKQSSSADAQRVSHTEACARSRGDDCDCGAAAGDEVESNGPPGHDHVVHAPISRSAVLAHTAQAPSKTRGKRKMSMIQPATNNRKVSFSIPPWTDPSNTLPPHELGYPSVATAPGSQTNPSHRASGDDGRLYTTSPAFSFSGSNGLGNNPGRELSPHLPPTAHSRCSTPGDFHIYPSYYQRSISYSSNSRPQTGCSPLSGDASPTRRSLCTIDEEMSRTSQDFNYARGRGSFNSLLADNSHLAPANRVDGKLTVDVARANGFRSQPGSPRSSLQLLDEDDALHVEEHDRQLSGYSSSTHSAMSPTFRRGSEGGSQGRSPRLSSPAQLPATMSPPSSRQGGSRSTSPRQLSSNTVRGPKMPLPAEPSPPLSYASSTEYSIAQSAPGHPYAVTHRLQESPVLTATGSGQATTKIKGKAASIGNDVDLQAGDRQEHADANALALARTQARLSPTPPSLIASASSRIQPPPPPPVTAKAESRGNDEYPHDSAINVPENTTTAHNTKSIAAPEQLDAGRGSSAGHHHVRHEDAASPPQVTKGQPARTAARSAGVARSPGIRRRGPPQFGQQRRRPQLPHNQAQGSHESDV